MRTYGFLPLGIRGFAAAGISSSEEPIFSSDVAWRLRFPFALTFWMMKCQMKLILWSISKAGTHRTFATCIVSSPAFLRRHLFGFSFSFSPISIFYQVFVLSFAFYRSSGNADRCTLLSRLSFRWHCMIGAILYDKECSEPLRNTRGGAGSSENGKVRVARESNVTFRVYQTKWTIRRFVLGMAEFKGAKTIGDHGSTF